MKIIIDLMVGLIIGTLLGAVYVFLTVANKKNWIEKLKSKFKKTDKTALKEPELVVEKNTLIKKEGFSRKKLYVIEK